MCVAYVASPIANFYKLMDSQRAKKEIVGLAEKYCIIAKGKGLIPISTPINFCNIYDELTERELALESCIQILKKCEVFIYNSNDLSISKGVALELQTARECKLKIIDIASEIEAYK